MSPSSRTRTARLYTLWSDLQECCRNPHHPAYPRYGGRGIRLAPAWAAYADFRVWALATGYTGDAYLLRLDPDGDFTPDNCAWTTLPDAADFARSPRLLAAFGEERTVGAWARDARCRVSASTVRKRLALGWPLERALTTPSPPPPTFTAFGDTKTATAWLDDPRCVVTLSTLRGRLAQGWSFADALTTPILVNLERLTPVYTVFGETRPLAAWLDDPRCVASRAAVKGRLRRGWPLERALTTPTAFTRDIHQLTAFGRTQPLRVWAADPCCRVSARGLLTRLQHGWAPEEALTIPPGQERQRTLTAWGERQTLAAWLRDARCQVEGRVVCQRLRQGWTPEAALATPGALVFASDGEAFGVSQSPAAWARDPRCQVPYLVLLQRLRRGWPLERALTTPQTRSTHPTALTAFGETHTLAAWQRDPRCVVGSSTILDRLARGWTLEAALTTPPLPYPHSKDVTAYGDTQSISAWLRDPRCGVDRHTLLRRLQQGWTPEDAISLPGGARRGRQITGFGCTQSIREWARDARCRVSYTTLAARLAAGWPLEEALTTSPFDPLPQLTAFGETQPISVWAADPRCRVSRKTLRERLRDGWPAERALTTPPRHRDLVHREEPHAAPEPLSV